MFRRLIPTFLCINDGDVGGGQDIEVIVQAVNVNGEDRNMILSSLIPIAPNIADGFE